MFITLEGPEGSGKTTQATWLADWLAGRGLHVLALREPGGTLVGDAIRDLLLNVKWQVDPRAELLLYSASRAQLVANVIRPHLQAGGVVVCDRYVDSSLAYQGYGRGLDLSALHQITSFATGGLVPDLTLYLDIDPGEGLARRRQSGESLNRLDAEKLEFHQRVRAGYMDLIARDPSRWIKIDASGPPELVRETIAASVAARLKDLHPN